MKKFLVSFLVIVCIAVMTGCAAEEPEKVDWGITLSAQDVTPTGMTLVCTQSGGDVSGELTCGTDYALYVLKTWKWTPAPALVDPIDWTAEGYILPQNGSITFELNWEGIYGELSAGTYRIAKVFLDSQEGVSYGEETFYTEFEITG